MITEQERALISKFVIKNKQDRYISFLQNTKTRVKFTQSLYHFKDFEWSLFREIPGSEIEREVITTKLVGEKQLRTCFVISVDANYDGKVVSLEEAIENILGTEGTVLIFGDADIVYYEGEAPNRRYISI